MVLHYFLGIDVSKLTLDFALLNQEEKVLVQSQRQNPEKSIQQLLEQLIKTHQIEPQQLLICLEHTVGTVVKSKFLFMIFSRFYTQLFHSQLSLA